MAEDQFVQSYAQAVFEQAVDRWRKSLRAVSENLERAPNSLTTLDNAAEQLPGKKEVINRLLPAGADEELRNFLYLLASKSQVHLLPQVLAEFDRLATRGPLRDLARVTSAVPLTDSERAQLERKIRAQYGDNLDLEYRVDKSLLGGVVIRVGDKVIDGSVAAKLASMKQKLAAR
jgi:F-type H+-transporting ATPase subunit delta